jgi:chromate transporter
MMRLKQTRSSSFLGSLAIAGMILNLMGINILAILFGTGMFAGTWQGLRQDRASNWKPVLIMLSLTGGFLMVTYIATGLYSAGKVPFGLLPLFLFFVKVGSVVFGSGYVLLAFLQTDLVAHWHWLTSTQLLDAIAVGQVTPGPVFTTATFIGYLLAGLPGALIATAGIFLPSFFLVAVINPLIPRLRKSPVAGAFLDGVIVASLALMAVVTWHLGRDAIIDLPTVILAIISAVMLIRFRLNSLWLVLGGAVIGILVHMGRMFI